MTIRQTLRSRLPDLRTETLRAFAKLLKELADGATRCAEIAQQLDMMPLAVELRDLHARIDAARLSVTAVAR